MNLMDTFKTLPEYLAWKLGMKTGNNARNSFVNSARSAGETVRSSMLSAGTELGLQRNALDEFQQNYARDNMWRLGSGGDSSGDVSSDYESKKSLLGSVTDTIDHAVNTWRSYFGDADNPTLSTASSRAEEDIAAGEPYLDSAPNLPNNAQTSTTPAPIRLTSEQIYQDKLNRIRQAGTSWMKSNPYGKQFDKDGNMVNRNAKEYALSLGRGPRAHVAKYESDQNKYGGIAAAKIMSLNKAINDMHTDMMTSKIKSDIETAAKDEEFVKQVYYVDRKIANMDPAMYNYIDEKTKAALRELIAQKLKADPAYFATDDAVEKFIDNFRSKSK